MREAGGREREQKKSEIFYLIAWDGK